MDMSVLQNIPFGLYLEESFQGLYLTSHQLMDFRACPLLYRQKLNGDIMVDDTAAFAIGRATHALVLGGQEKFDEEYLVSTGPINPKTGEPYGKLTKAYKDWASEQSKTIILTNEFDFMAKLRDSVYSHGKACELLDGGYAEQTIRCEYRGEQVQIRMDLYNPKINAIVDLKTCDNLDWFMSDSIKYGYAEQMSFYREVFTQATGGPAPTMWLIGVEKKIPYRCGVWQLSDALLAQAKATNDAAMDELRACRERDVWPTRYEDVRIMDIPEAR